MKTGTIIAIIVVLILVVGGFMWYRRSHPAGYTAQPPAAVWNGTNDYPCPTGYTTLPPDGDWCVLPSLSVGVAACNSDPKCVGVLKPTTASAYSAWHQPVGSVALAAQQPIGNSSHPNTVFYQKKV